MEELFHQRQCPLLLVLDKSIGACCIFGIKHVVELSLMLKMFLIKKPLGLMLNKLLELKLLISLMNLVYQEKLEILVVR